MSKCKRCGRATTWMQVMGLKPFRVQPGGVYIRTTTIGAEIINIVTPRGEIFEGTPVDKSEGEQLKQSGQWVRRGFILHNSICKQKEQKGALL